MRFIHGITWVFIGNLLNNITISLSSIGQHLAVKMREPSLAFFEISPEKWASLPRSEQINAAFAIDFLQKIPALLLFGQLLLRNRCDMLDGRTSTFVSHRLCQRPSRINEGEPIF